MNWVCLHLIFAHGTPRGFCLKLRDSGSRDENVLRGQSKKGCCHIEPEPEPEARLSLTPPACRPALGAGGAQLIFQFSVPVITGPQTAPK